MCNYRGWNIKWDAQIGVYYATCNGVTLSATSRVGIERMIDKYILDYEWVSIKKD